MSDNLFDRLFELFQTSDTVNWRLAEEITKSVAGAVEPIEPRLAEEYEELALAGQLRLSGTGRLDPGEGVIPHPIDRAGWARENHRAFDYLVEPLAAAMSAGSGGDATASMLAPLGPALVGMQAGTLVGMSSRTALGQFDNAFPPLGQRRAYLIVPNVESFATEHGLDPRQVRLWAVLHELTYSAVVADATARDHVAAAAKRICDGLDFDPARLVERLGRMQDPAQLEGMLSEPDGLSDLFGGGREPGFADELLAAAALIEGYGDYVVRLAAAPLLPDLDAIERAHASHRDEPDEGVELIGQILGIDVDRSRARDAAALCEAIATRWGDEGLDQMWAAPGNLPRLGELTDVIGWAARVLLD